MPMKKPWTPEDTEAAIHRANGNLLKDLKAGTPKDFAKARTQYTTSGKKRGHEYMHRASTGPGFKSRYGSRYCCIQVTCEMLNHPLVQADLEKFDQGTKTDTWIKDIPIVGDWYGYPRDADNQYGELHKIGKACINLVTDGTNLYIYSTYPSDFQGEMTYDLTSLFG